MSEVSLYLYCKDATQQRKDGGVGGGSAGRTWHVPWTARWPLAEKSVTGTLWTQVGETRCEDGHHWAHLGDDDRDQGRGVGVEIGVFITANNCK